jgi:LPXTG-site transpeptidase (sortase) family protein
LNINGGVALLNGRYTLTISGSLRDTLGAPIGTDFVRHFYVDNGHPHHTSIATIPNNAAIINGTTVNVSFSSIDIAFDEDLSNMGGGAVTDDVTNPQNYLLVTPGTNGTFDTLSCAAGLDPNDVQIPTGPVTYDNNGGAGPFVATVQLNGGTALPNGLYRLYICGTTSIVDLAGNPLNGDAGPDSQVNFTVLVLSGARNPKTGFAPGVLTVLPEQPADKAYTSLGDLWIEIPKLNLKTSITGVPLTTDGWDLTWLNRQVGWLEGTAYPTWEGNTVLTAHGYTADGEAGPFALLKNLAYGETIVIHLGGMKYIYAVRTNLLISPNDTRWLTRHEKLDWITLITCQQYDAQTNSYRYRRVVRAVLVRVEEE